MTATTATGARKTITKPKIIAKQQGKSYLLLSLWRRKILSWKEYEMIEGCLADWLPWGGITHPAIMQCKDDSFFGVIEYKPYCEKENIVTPNFRNGWNLWIEHQHIPSGDDKDFLVLGWNPFFDRQGRIINGTGKQGVPWKAARNAFYRVLYNLSEQLGKITECKVLEYQEILDFLEFTLAMDERKVEMPEVPMYLDALLSQDVQIDFRHHLQIDDKKLCIVSLPAMARRRERQQIADIITDYSYRHVQRLLLLGEKRSRKEINWYTGNWCRGRRSLKNFIVDGVLGNLNGYHMEAYIIALPKREYEIIETDIRQQLNRMELPYIIEDFNHKHVWWGSIPGMFRSNIVPPIVGFENLVDLLYKADVHHEHRQGEAGESENVSDELVQA